MSLNPILAQGASEEKAENARMVSLHLFLTISGVSLCTNVV